VLQRKGRAGRVRDGFGADPNPHQSTIANVTGF
jgi:hypothetical protein